MDSNLQKKRSMSLICKLFVKAEEHHSTLATNLLDNMVSVKLYVIEGTKLLFVMMSDKIYEKPSSTPI